MSPNRNEPLRSATIGQDRRMVVRRRPVPFCLHPGAAAETRRDRKRVLHAAMIVTLAAVVMGSKDLLETPD